MISVFIIIAIALCVGFGWHWAHVKHIDKSDTPRRRRPERSLTEIVELISQPAVVKERTKRYVCGFAFHGGTTTRPRVVLIRKVKPDWQAGKLNGVGGKVEPGESSTVAMAREFREETGVETKPEDWQVFAKMHFPKAEVTFLRYFGEAVAVAKTQTVWSDELRAMITEPVEHRLVRGIDEIPEGCIVPNLRWAIPMGYHTEGGRNIVTVDYTEHN